MLKIIQDREQYQYGVIYAVRVSGVLPLDRLRTEAGGGLYALEAIPPSALLGKVIVTEFDAESHFRQKSSDEEFDRLVYWRSILGKGVVRS